MKKSSVFTINKRFILHSNVTIYTRLINFADLSPFFSLAINAGSDGNEIQNLGMQQVSFHGFPKKINLQS
jgi:hypothetical protein